MPLIELNHIYKYYGQKSNKVVALCDINLQVNKGDFLAISGSSGSGKSTLMNMLGCLDVQSEGEYFLDGNSVSKLNENQLSHIRNKEIGFIFQKYHLIPQYSVLQNIIMQLLIRGMDRQQAVEIAQESIEMVVLSDRLNHNTNELAGVQQHRFEIISH